MPAAPMATSRTPVLPDGARYTWSQTADAVVAVVPVPVWISAQEDLESSAHKTVIVVDDTKIRVAFETIREHPPLDPTSPEYRENHDEPTFDDIRLLGRFPHPVAASRVRVDYVASGASALSKMPAIRITLPKQTAVDWPLLLAAGHDTPLADDSTLDDMDSDSIFHLACFILEHKHDTARSKRYFEIAARHGSVVACMKLGAWYFLGSEKEASIPVKCEMDVAREWHERAAMLGSAEAAVLVSEEYIPAEEPTYKTALSDMPMADLMKKGLSFLDLAKSIILSYIPVSFDDSTYNISIPTALPDHLQTLLGITCFKKASILPMLHDVDMKKMGDEIAEQVCEEYHMAAICRHPLAMYNYAIMVLNGIGTGQDVKRGLIALKVAIEYGKRVGMALDYPNPKLARYSTPGPLQDVIVTVFENQRLDADQNVVVLDVDELVNVTEKIVAAAGGAEEVSRKIKEKDINFISKDELEKLQTKAAANGEKKKKNKKKKKKGRSSASSNPDVDSTPSEKLPSLLDRVPKGLIPVVGITAAVAAIAAIVYFRKSKKLLYRSV